MVIDPLINSTSWNPRLIMVARGITVAAIAVQLVAPTFEAIVSRLTFAIIFGIGALVIAGRSAPFVQLAGASTYLAASIAMNVIARPVADPPSTLWGQIIDDTRQEVAHRIIPPYGTRQWQQGWVSDGQPFIYVCARGRLEPPETLVLTVNGSAISVLNPSQMFGPRPQPESVGFYRISVPRDLFSGSPALDIHVRPDERATKPLEICGTITARPTAGLESSQFFDGASWTSPWATRKGRFQIELRLEGPGGHVFGAWY